MIASLVPARIRHAQSDTPGARACCDSVPTRWSGLARSAILLVSPKTLLLISDPPPWVPRSTVTIVTPVLPLRHPPTRQRGADRRPKGVGVMGEHTAVPTVGPASGPTAGDTSGTPVRVLIVE